MEQQRPLSSKRAHGFGFLLQVYYLREEVRDLLLLAGGILGLTRQFLRYGGDLEAGRPWRDGKGVESQRQQAELRIQLSEPVFLRRYQRKGVKGLVFAFEKLI